MLYDVVIIGAGTAGMTAAIYALRAGKTVMILESENFGGQITYTPKVENYPGIKQISGNEFASNLYEQVNNLGANWDLATVQKIEDNGKYKKVITDTNQYECKAVIIATGVKPKKLGLPKEDEFLGEGICYCAVCDGAFFANQIVAVVGGGNTALTDALFLSNYCKKVYLIHRRQDFSAEKTLINEVKAKENIQIIMQTNVSKLIGENSLTGIELINEKGNKSILECTALFVAIGHTANNQPFEGYIDLDKQGFILAQDCKTSKEGVFAAGDCRKKELRQLTTAVSDGAIAGLLAAQYSDRIK